MGYEAPSVPGTPAEWQEIRIADVVAQVARAGDAGLPRQLQAATLAGASRPTRAFRSGRAWGLVVVQPETVVVQAVIVPPDARRQGEGTWFLQVLAHEFPGRQFMVPTVVPEGLADGFMLGNGSQHGERSQWEIGCSLA